MAVSDAHKGRGLGRALMAACVERARAAGAPRLYLETNSGLAPALALYRSFGFREIQPDDALALRPGRRDHGAAPVGSHPPATVRAG